uniref:Uncharacterized protein n=1 Tax=Oryza brachyantha TaxID=4533 RepID=J3KZH4_ORYBR
MAGSAADAVIPACAVVGIAFAAWQWFVVCRTKVPYATTAAARNGVQAAAPVFRPEGEADVAVDGYGDEEEGDGDRDGAAAVVRCAEIQNAISVGIISERDVKIKYDSILLSSGKSFFLLDAYYSFYTVSSNKIKLDKIRSNCCATFYFVRYEDEVIHDLAISQAEAKVSSGQSFDLVISTGCENTPPATSLVPPVSSPFPLEEVFPFS